MKTETSFKGKAIYQPKGKAAEYSEWACNFYVGCSNLCIYCYLKKGRGAKILGGCEPTLKSCFKSEEHALDVFEKELKANLPELQKHGLFFSFTTDPMLKETAPITLEAVKICCGLDVPVKILTKKTNYIFSFLTNIMAYKWDNIAFGFTLTGHDELEPNASTNQERIEAMKRLHEAGFRTFASIEPIIDLDSSYSMICEACQVCYLFKIGLESGKKYDKKKLNIFIMLVLELSFVHKFKVYFKDSLLALAGISRDELPANCVNRDYNLFKEE